VLTLPIKKKWFDMIESGEKKEEYRNPSLYYIVRFGFDYCLGLPFQTSFQTIRLRNGYSKNSPMLECAVKIDYAIGKPEWGAPKEECFVLEILEFKRVV